MEFRRADYITSLLGLRVSSVTKSYKLDTGVLGGSQKPLTSVTIVIPVYGNPTYFSRAIDSVLQYGDLAKNKLIVINDCGPSTPQIKAIAKKAMLSFSNIEYFENDLNLGFGETCNRAVFELDESSNDVLLLNSDAELTRGALQELQSVLAQSNQHACVSPRTNQGTISTVPYYPRRLRSREESFDFFKKQHRLLPRYSVAPVSPGFCMLIRRDVIQVHGLFDEVFSPGYDEENDFCMRINSVGLSSVIANHAFVFHGSGKSFGKRREPLAERHSQILNRRFPFYQRLIEQYHATGVDPVDKFLDYIDPLNSPSILLDCSALSEHLNGTSRNILSFLDFLSSKATFKDLKPRFTILANRSMSHFYGLNKLGFKISFVEDGIHELFDVGFALSPVWSKSALDRLVTYCSRFAILHLDIIAIRTWELNGTSVNRERAVYSAVEWADLTIFISNASRKDFLDFKPNARIRNGKVIHQGIISSYGFQAPTEVKDHKKTGFRDTNRLSVLIVGNAFKHKQVDRAVDAIKSEDFDVVALAGHNSIQANVHKIRSGGLTDEHVNSLFEQADVIVFPSAYEGFGLPIAEALKAHKPLVVFETLTSREVVAVLGGQNSTYFFNDFSMLSDQIKDASKQIYECPPHQLRSSDDFNAEVLSEILNLSAKTIDTNFLRERAKHFRELAIDELSHNARAQLERLSVRWSSKLADVLWGPFYSRIFRK